MSDNALSITAVNKLLNAAGSTLRICVNYASAKKKGGHRRKNEKDRSFLTLCNEWAMENAEEEPKTFEVNKRGRPKASKTKEKGPERKRESLLPIAERTRSAARRRALTQIHEDPSKEQDIVAEHFEIKPTVRKRKSRRHSVVQQPKKRVHFDEATDNKDENSWMDTKERPAPPLRSPPLIKQEEETWSDESGDELLPKPMPMPVPMPIPMPLPIPIPLPPPPIKRRASLAAELIERMREQRENVPQPQSQSQNLPAPMPLIAPHPQRLQFAPEPTLRPARHSVSAPGFSGQMPARPWPLERRPSWAGRPSLLGSFAEPLLEDYELDLNANVDVANQTQSIDRRRPSFINFGPLSPIDSVSDKSASTTANTHSTGLQPSTSVGLQPQPYPEHSDYDNYYDNDLNRSHGVRQSLPPEMKRMVEEGLRDLPRHLTVRRTLENRCSVLPKNFRQSNAQYLPSNDSD